MERSYIMPRLCFILTFALTLFSVVLRSLCMVFYFDVDPGYFTADLMPVLSNVLYFVAITIALVCVSLTPKDSLSSELHTRLRAPVAIILGLSLAAFTVISFIVCFPSRQSKLMIAPTLLGLFAAIYFLLSAKRNGRYPDRLSFLGYLPVLWSIGAIGEIYFDNYTTMNSPIKTSLLFALLGFMFIMLAELRFRVNQPMPRYSVFMLSVGGFTTLTGSIPVLVATGAGKLDHIRHLLYAAVLLFAGLYGFYLLFRYTLFPSDVPDETTDEPTEAVEESNTTISETVAPNAE